RIIPETMQPLHLRFAPKPCQLPLGVVAMRLLGRQQRLLTRKLSAPELPSMLVIKRCERPRGIAILFQQTLGLFDQSSLEHQLRAAVNALVQSLTFGVEPQ